MLISIRKATPADLDDITSLFKETVVSINSKDYSAEQIEVWKQGAFKKEKWLEKISVQHFLIAETNSIIAGFGSITRDGYLDFLYVDKDHQRKGTARKIYEELEKSAKANGVSKITSDVSITAKPFFQQQGFAVTREQQVNIDGVKLTNYKMEKLLLLD